MLILLKKVYVTLERTYCPEVSSVHAPSEGVRNCRLEDEQEFQCDQPPLGYCIKYKVKETFKPSGYLESSPNDRHFELSLGGRIVRKLWLSKQMCD